MKKPSNLLALILLLFTFFLVSEIRAAAASYQNVSFQDKNGKFLTRTNDGDALVLAVQGSSLEEMARQFILQAYDGWNDCITNGSTVKIRSAVNGTYWSASPGEKLIMDTKPAPFLIEFMEGEEGCLKNGARVYLKAWNRYLTTCENGSEELFFGEGSRDTLTDSNVFTVSIGQTPKYADVSFESAKTGKYISRSDESDGWLVADQTKSEYNPTRFVIETKDGSNPYSQCIVSGTKISIRSISDDYYWHWYDSQPGMYGYYAKKNDPSKFLRLIKVAGSDSSCVEDGDTIAFKDWATINYYYMKNWQEGIWKDKLFLWDKGVGQDNEFIIHFSDPEPGSDDTRFVQRLEKKFDNTYHGEAKASYHFSANNELPSDWLIATPTKVWGKSYDQYPMVEKAQEDFGVMPVDGQCGDQTLLVDVQATVTQPGGIAQKRCVGHSYSYYDDIYKTIIKGEALVDITSLTEPTGRFRTAIRNAVTYLSNKTGNKPVIRFMFGQPAPFYMTVNMEEFLKDMTRDVTSDIEIYAGAYWASLTSWNHSKIIAVDGKQALVGGHNMWDEHYLGKNPVFDLSMKLSGEAVLDGHRFSSLLWDYVQDYNKWITDATWSVQCARFLNPVAGVEYGQQFLPPLDIVSRLGQNYGQTVYGNIPVLSVGRLGDIDNNNNQSDMAWTEMIKAAKSEINMSIQGVQSQVPPKLWPEEQVIELARALYSGVDISLVVSSPDALGGGLGIIEAPYYGDDPSILYNKIFDVLRDLIKEGDFGPPVFVGEKDVESILGDHLKIAALRIGGSTRYPNGDSIANHSKTIMVDRQFFYIGSHNLYPCNLAEFGYIIEDSEKAMEFWVQFWEPLFADVVWFNKNS
ncbi:MAG: hypothetical protein GY710_07910 [Desulfobacteraceae bacterium]|nr:hypothetical protein [Desulfobacteraceae bacterium]